MNSLLDTHALPVTAAGFSVQVSYFLAERLASLPFVNVEFLALLFKAEKYDDDFALPSFKDKVRNNLWKHPAHTIGAKMQRGDLSSLLEADSFFSEDSGKIVQKNGFSLRDCYCWSMVVRVRSAMGSVFARGNSQPAFTVENPSNIPSLTFRKFYGWFRWWLWFTGTAIVSGGSQFIAPGPITFRRIWTGSPSVGGPTQFHWLTTTFANTIKNIRRFIVFHNNEINNHWVDSQVVFYPLI